MEAKKYKECSIVIKIGDLLEEEAEAIVNPANSLMIMGGGVAGIIKKKGGEEIEEEAKKYAPVEVGKAIITKAGKLKFKYVIHSPTMERPAMLTTFEKVYKATLAALESAYNHGIKKVSFPAMGTGVGGLSYSEAAKAMLSAIKDFLEKFTIEEIKIVLLNKDAYENFVLALHEMFKK
ncbi:MAG: macro domain-containing protein [Thermoproteota archaeon]|jgi:O-acetyl-ADP-ribose deacetylase (regulator of RNase III)|nr:macro domain-containing protein [Thermoproteota archaeon]